MKKHYVTRWAYERFTHVTAVCGKRASTLFGYGTKVKATYHKNHVTCGNCRRTKMFRDVR